MQLIATSAFGLEAVVARELKTLGYEPKIVQSGRILFEGDEQALCRANLWLRAADRVLVRLGEFEATDFGVLFDATFALPWEEWIPREGEFPVSGRSIKSQLSSVPACQKIVKKAIVERLRARHGAAELPETGPKYSVEVALSENRATLTLDTSGPGLHKRGYRRLVGPAPLKETLAAAMIGLSYWNPERTLVDPFCGSGTIPIEAALVGRNIAPGLNRTFAAEAWPRVAAATWETVRQEARDAIRPELPERIMGTDADPAALSLARHHAERAGVAADIHFQERSFAELTSKRPYGCLICNPPYGERMGQQAEVAALYRAMPDVFRRLKTWSFYILTAYPEFERVVGQEADRRRKLYNGHIECTYYQFYGPRPPRRRIAAVPEFKHEAQASESTEASAAHYKHEAQASESTGASAALPKRPLRPAFGGLSEKARHQAELFRRRLEKRAHHLRRWPTKMGITCYRLYERDIPEVPLVVDRYEDNLHIAEFDRPHEHTPAEHGDWLDLMRETAADVLEIKPANVYLKRRQRQRGESQYERVATDEAVRIVSEGGLRFEVNLSDYVNTGLFLDHRTTRGMVRAAAQGKRFLNLFAYTGSFTVYAAAGGAATTLSVDLSNTYLDWAERNLALNTLAGPQHTFIRTDVMEFLAARRGGPTFDLAVVDPPTFSNSKRLDDIFDIQRDHVELLKGTIALLAPGGVLFFSTNFRRFKLAEEQLAGVTIRDITRQTVPADFRNERIHRAWRMVKSPSSEASKSE